MRILEISVLNLLKVLLELTLMIMNKGILFSLLGIIGLISCNSNNNSKENENLPPTEEVSTFQSVDSQGAKVLLEKEEEIVLLDVRTPEEFAEGHLKGAINLDFYAADFRQQLALLNPNQKYMVYCAVGGRSGKTGKMMEELGFGQVYNVTEGFAELSRKGIPVAELDRE